LFSTALIIDGADVVAERLELTLNQFDAILGFRSFAD
jgi:hypothetical protein